MLNKKIGIGILALVLVFSMMVIGCPKSETSLEGAWIDDEGTELIFNDGIFSVMFLNDAVFQGTYIVEDDNIIVTATHNTGLDFGLDPDLLSGEEIADLLTVIHEWNDEDIEEFSANFFTPTVYNYQLSGKTLTLSTMWFSSEFTRK